MVTFDDEIMQFFVSPQFKRRTMIKTKQFKIKELEFKFQG